MPSFQSTQPPGTPDLMRASDFRRWLDGQDGAPPQRRVPNSRLSDLPASLMQDLMRFERHDAGGDPLQVLAACVRHSQSLAMHLQWNQHVLTVTLFPAQRLLHCQVPMSALRVGPLEQMQVLQVERPALRPPDDRQATPAGEAAHYQALRPFLWLVALRGPRQTLLHEISGQAAYRVAPGLDFTGLDIPAPAAACIAMLRRQTCNLREISALPQMDAKLATRVLNGLYLQAGLIVSRTHPAATNEGWKGY